MLQSYTFIYICKTPDTNKTHTNTHKKQKKIKDGKRRVK